MLRQMAMYANVILAYFDNLSPKGMHRKNQNEYLKVYLTISKLYLKNLDFQDERMNTRMNE